MSLEQQMNYSQCKANLQILLKVFFETEMLDK